MNRFVVGVYSSITEDESNDEGKKCINESYICLKLTEHDCVGIVEGYDLSLHKRERVSKCI